MKDSELLPAPQISLASTIPDKWERERRAFLELRPSLLSTHSGKYVAIHEGRVVDRDEDEIALGLRVYSKFGYQPIYFGRVSTDAPRIVRIPSPRLR